MGKIEKIRAKTVIKKPTEEQIQNGLKKILEEQAKKERLIKITPLKKLLKEPYLAKGCEIDSDAKRITKMLTEIEEPLKTEKQREDDNAKAIIAAAEAKEQARIDGIKAKIEALKVDQLELLNLKSDEIGFEFGLLEEKEITSEEYQEFTHEANQTKAAYLAILNKAMIDRRQQEEDDIKRKVEDAHLAAERLVQKAETEKLAEQAARIKEAQDKLDVERAQIEAEKQAEIDRKAREERENQIREDAKKQAEEAAKARVEKAERDRIAQAKADAEETARQETLRQDKERLKDWVMTSKGYCEKIAPITKKGETYKLQKKFLGDLNNLVTDFIMEIDKL